MNKKKYSGFIIGGILLLLGICGIVGYNGLVQKDEKIKLQWAEIQNAYQRRLDLLPNLVNVVKGGADYEKTTLQKLAEARAALGGTTVSVQGMEAQLSSQNQLSGAVNRLLISVENYPDLKGTQAFRDLQTQLEGTERRIKIARKDFNEAIQVYNSSVRSFPTNLLARIFGFEVKSGFDAVAGAENIVEIKF